MSASTGIFDDLLGQPMVSTFLSTALSDGNISHAYLFLGKPGSGKTVAAYDLAAALLCDEGGCGSCDSCVRVLRRTHPDVHYLAPQGVAAYVVDQIRELIHDASLAPIRGNRKIYIIDRADLLQGAPANALLKTLEEPPDKVTFILLGRTREAMLPTILSRCQVVPFRTIPALEAAGMLTQETGADIEAARIALASSGYSLVRARDFLLSPSRREVRTTVLRVLDGLSAADDMDVLEAAREVVDVLKQPITDIRLEQEKELAASADYLARSMLRSLEERQKRELGARQRQGMAELFSLVDSWLRDCLLICEGRGDAIVGTDCRDALLSVCQRVDTEHIVRALGAVDRAALHITYNVSPQLVMENLLFDIREAIR